MAENQSCAAMEEVRDRLTRNHGYVRPEGETSTEDDRLRLRMDLEHHRGHLHASYGSR